MQKKFFKPLDKGKMLKYIHENPVKEKIVTEAENYYFSSERNYADFIALDVEVVFMGWDKQNIEKSE